MKNNSKFVDIAATVNVIGNLYKNPSLLEETDKYNFTEEDFPNTFMRNVFGCIYNLFQLGNNKITMQAIESYLAQRPKIAAEFKTNKGAEFLVECGEKAEPATFNYYYNRIKKMSLLRAYESLGMDLSWLYDPDNIFDSKKKQEQEDFIDNHTVGEINNKINDKIEAIKAQYVDETDNSTCTIGDGIFDLLEELKESPDLGYPMFGPYMNTITRGARFSKFYLRSAPSNVGKAIPNDTLIPTPEGWRKVSDIKVGDYLIGQNGKPTKVLAVYPQSEKKDIWEVELKDGRIAKCCGEHLWEYRCDAHRGYTYRVEDTKTIYERTLKLKNGFRNSEDKGYRFHIKLNEAVEYPERSYSIHPYVMGAMLGDSSFRYSKTNKAISFSSKDDELPNKIANLLGNYTYNKSSDYNYNYTFKPLNNLEHNLWVEELLKDYPELWQAKSEDKFIPRDYLLGSIEQRYELLRGLLDTNGSIDNKGVVRFTTISPKLRDDIIELSRSLGMVSNYLVDARKDKYSTGECYSIVIQSKKEIKPLMFSLKYKVDIATTYANSNKRNEHKDHLAIVDIRKTTEKTDMTCFTVDNDDHLFLMNDYIVTHNTRAMIADACYISCSQMYDLKTNKWITIGTCQPTLLITTEQSLQEVQQMCLAFLSGVNENHIALNEYYSGEEERVRKAAQLLVQSKLHFVEIPDFSLQDIENTIKTNIRTNGVKFVFFDYLHTSMGILAEITQRAGGVKLREDNVLFMLAVKLKDIATMYDVFMMSSTQLNGDWKTTEVLDMNCLRGAKAIADKIDIGFIMVETTKDDIEKLKPFLSKNGLPTPNIKMAIYKNRANEHKNEYMFMFADKGICRYETLFITDFNYNIIDVPDLKISVQEESMF